MPQRTKSGKADMWPEKVNAEAGSRRAEPADSPTPPEPSKSPEATLAQGTVRVNRPRHRTRVDAAAVAHEALQAFGPETFASDLTWDLFGYWAGFYHWFGPLRPSIQPLARRCRRHPDLFRRQADRIFQRYLRKVGKEPWFQQSVALWSKCEAAVAKYLPQAEQQPPDSPTFPEGASQRQLRAMSETLPIFRSTIRGRPVKANPKRLLANLGSLAAKRPGPHPDALTKRIRKIDGRARAQGRHLTDGYIAAKVFPRYGKWDSVRRGEARDMVKERRRLTP